MTIHHAKRLSPVAPVEDFVSWLDRWSYFQNSLHIGGYAFSQTREPIEATLVLGGVRTVSIPHFRLPSPDLTVRFGRVAAASRFREVIPVPEGEQTAMTAVLEFTFADGSIERISTRSKEELADPVHGVTKRFFDMLNSLPHGRMLEIGSRNRTGDIRKGLLPQDWDYVGLDILEGENVDIVGDAHETSRLLPANSFDAIMSFAVFEHLLMPWKVALEVNKVLKVGAIGLVVAPHTWPLHEEPCDYFRFSRHSWKALFNKSTGFEILESADGCPAFIVAERLSPSTAWSEFYRGALMSSVIFRKVSETTVDWSVSLSDIADDLYPF